MSADKPDPLPAKAPDPPLPPGWARIASKKRPGRFYYFNAATNSSLWEHPVQALAREAKIVANVGAATKTTTTTTERKAVKAGEEKVVQLRNDGQFKRGNLAKERMDKLRKELQEDRKKASPRRKPEEKVSTKKTEVPFKRAEVKPDVSEKRADTKPTSNEKKVVLSSVSTSKKKDVSKSSPLRLKRKISEESPVHAKMKSEESPLRGVRSRAIVKTASTKEKAKPKVETLEVIKKESLKKFKIPKKPPEEPVSSPVFADIQKLEEVKLPEVSIAKPSSEPVVQETFPKSPANDRLVNLRNQIVQAKKSPDPSPVIVNIQELQETHPPLEVTIATPISTPQPVVSPKSSSEHPPQCQSTPKEVRETFAKFSANDRLANLRSQIAQNVTLDEDAEMTDLSNLDSSVEVEQMEWEDIPEEVALQEVVTIRRSLGLKLTNPDLLNTSIPETNLLEPVAFNRFFLMVVDTNIFLSHLKTLEQILTTSLPTVGQPILILPYIVLQELDRIKHREAGRPLSQVASHSIRFLNDHLKRRDPRVRGQSTMEAAEPLIPIENPDDHILNCCIQVGRSCTVQQGTELLLLSNDVNLRNKALVSGLTAVSFAELMAEAERLRKVAAESR